MRKFLILILLLCTCYGYADWFVFAVNETVERQSNDGWQLLQKGDRLFATDNIRMSQYASLSVLDDQSKRVYPLQCTTETKLTDLMQQMQSSSSPALVRYAKTILNIFHSEDQEALVGSAGVSYRDAAADRIVADILRRRLNGNTWSNVSYLSSDYRLEMQSVCLDKGELCHIVNEGERIRLLVSNHSNRALFVAILDVDAGGSPQVLLPQNVNEMIGRMFIPAYSTVLLPEVLSFAPAGIDYLYLIAYDEPFDIQQVLTLMQTTDATIPVQTSTSKLGCTCLVMNIR